MSQNVPNPRASQETVFLLLKDIADTTWRMFVPTIGGGALGWWVGKVARLGQWPALVGLLIGCGITAILMKRQFGALKKS